MKVSAIPADPYGLSLGALKNGVGGDGGGEGAIAFAMIFFSDGDAGHGCCDFGKAFCFGYCGEGGIHCLPLILFTLGCMLQILECCADDAGGQGHGDLHLAAFEEFEEALGVFLLLVCGLQEDGGDLLKAILLGLAGLVGIFVAGDGFSGKSL